MNKEVLIQSPDNIRPHVVVLGAGASRAAFPNGDGNGKRLPIMNDLVETLELSDMLEDNGINPKQNFELLYSNLTDEILLSNLESKISDYFSALYLPNIATDYDRLVLSLREKDAIFTFNWDPFLFDAWMRNHHIAKLPEIFFLHGNVRIGSCIKHQKWGRKHDACPVCNNNFSAVPLLYPIDQKNYSENEYIDEAWKNAKYFFSNAFTITIFGYGAPSSDIDAVELLRSAWFEGGLRQLEHIEIIDIADANAIYERWHSFTPTNHYQIRTAINESRVYQCPRRSCESLYYSMSQGIPCEAFPMPITDNLTELQSYISNIAIHEK